MAIPASLSGDGPEKRGNYNFLPEKVSSPEKTLHIKSVKNGQTKINQRTKVPKRR